MRPCTGFQSVKASSGVPLHRMQPHSHKYSNLALAFNKELWFALMADHLGSQHKHLQGSTLGACARDAWLGSKAQFRVPSMQRHTSVECKAIHPGCFLKVSACCKHFAAHSQEENRFQFDSLVNRQVRLTLGKILELLERKAPHQSLSAWSRCCPWFPTQVNHVE
jgi:hypothetical protein